MPDLPLPDQPVPDRDPVLDNAIDDAERVARMTTRLGKVPPDGFYDVLAAAKKARDGQAADRPPATAALQKALGPAVAGLAPITFANLKEGWDPFTPQGGKTWTAIAFGFLCMFIILSVCWLTLIYNRTVSVHATLVELQAAKTYEQLVNLVVQMQFHEQQLKKSVESGQPEPALEAFYQKLREIKRADERQSAYFFLSGLLMRGTILTPLLKWMGLDALDTTSPVLPAGPPMMPPGASNASPYANFDLLFQKVDEFNRVNDIQLIQPRFKQGLDFSIVALREAMNLLGGWLLPFLYGVLGAGVYHMRRYLDPLIPNPSLLRSTYRMILGGFAGIIVVWIWTPTPLKPSEPAFATLSAFSIAFLMGFSTDVFFQALDRLVINLSQWINGPAK